MKISLLMPTMNRREFLPRAIASVLAQDYQDWELLIGAWGDDVSDLIPNDSRIRRVPRTQQNLASALNDLMREASGDIIGMACDDDELTPSALTLVNFYMRDGGWLVGRILCGAELRGGPCDYNGLLDANLIPLPAAFWTRKISFGRVTHLFDPSVECAHDYDYWLRLMKIQAPTFIPDILAIYHEHPQQMTQTRLHEMSAHAEKARERAKQ